MLNLVGGFNLSAELQVRVCFDYPTEKLVVPLYNKYANAYCTLENAGQYF